MKGRFSLTGFNKFMAIYLAVLAFLLIVVGILDRFGLRLVYTGFSIGGVVLFLWSLMVWGAVALRRKLQRPAVRMAVTVVLVIVVLFAGTFMMQNVMMYTQFMLPHRFATIESPDGGSVALMYQWDFFAEDEAAAAEIEARMEARREMLLAEQEAAAEPTPAPEAAEMTSAPEAAAEAAEMTSAPEAAAEAAESTSAPEATAEAAESTPEVGATAEATEATASPESTAEPASSPASTAGADEETASPEATEEEELSSENMIGMYGYVYTAYPSVMGIFYRPDADTEGEIYRGYLSESRILYEWTDEGDTIRIYLEDAEPGDSGEIIVHK
ncbi:MAG TPA: hypothetical protein IAB50_09645 [Candidatus Faecivicinus avistercoris]|nr:hypothetical protein [Candidatus Faecivicinus avistercoris]